MINMVTDKYALHDAAEAGDVTQLELIINERQKTKQEWLQKLQTTENIEEFSQSILGFNHKAFECTPLHLAIINGHSKCVEILIAADCDLTFQCSGSPLLQLCVCTLVRQTDKLNTIFEMLIHCGIDILEPDELERTALHWCAIYGCIRPVEMLIARAQDLLNNGQIEIESIQEFLQLPDKDDNTILHLAIKHNQIEFVKWLVQSFLQDSIRSLGLHQNRQGWVPLHFACSRCSVDNIQFIYQLNSDAITVNDIFEKTPIDIARQEGKQVQLLNDVLKINQDVQILGQEYQNDAQQKEEIKAVVVTSSSCMAHLTCDHPIEKGTVGIPPENVGRLTVLLHPERGSLRVIRNIQIEEECEPAELSDILRVHNWKYVMELQQACNATEDEWHVVQLDGDTVISRGTFDGALKGCGAVIRGVNIVLNNPVKRVFCAIRPPGHHAGPSGKVHQKEVIDNVDEQETSSSHGFCIFNNVAVGAAYAMNVYRDQIKRVAILDIDVHHGNGTQACVLSTVPRVFRQLVEGPASRLEYNTYTCQPWLGVHDRTNILFASVQAYGSGFYPGTGATDDSLWSKVYEEEGLQEDPYEEFVYTGGDRSLSDGPRVINVGIGGPGVRAKMWQRAWRDKILPAVMNFSPDIIFVSAGFDAHRKDNINDDYIGLTERNFEWITEQIVQVGNSCCNGRVVSVLEGGYAIQGGAVSAFARSVQVHVQTLATGSTKKWDPQEAKIERQKELHKKLMLMQEAQLLADEIDQNNLLPKSNKRSRPNNFDYVALNKQWNTSQSGEMQKAAEMEVECNQQNTTVQEKGCQMDTTVEDSEHVLQ